MLLFFFFFSSRRRHTRCSRDWSSDVCSSDLHIRTKSRESLGELDTGRPGPDDDQFRRQPIEIEDRFVCEVGDAPQAWDRRYCRLSSGADDEVLGADPTPADLNRVAVYKSDGTNRDFNSLLGQNLRRFVGVNASDRSAYFRHHTRKIDSDFSTHDTVAPRLELVVSAPGDADQCLGRYAAGPGAVASHF